METIDQRVIPAGADGISFHVRVVPDDESSPYEWADADSDRVMLASWRAGDWRMVGVIVTPEFAGMEFPECADSLYGVEYGTCPSFGRDVTLDYACTVYPVPDMIGEARANLYKVRAVLATLPDRKMTDCVECKGHGQAHDSTCGNYQNPADWSTGDRA